MLLGLVQLELITDDPPFSMNFKSLLQWIFKHMCCTTSFTSVRNKIKLIVAFNKAKPT